MAETRQAGTLARTHEGQPGLPRGRSHLPPPAVSASQRERLLRSVTAAVSECGFPAVTVELEDTLVALRLAVLAGRPWPPGT